MIFKNTLEKIHEIQAIQAMHSLTKIYDSILIDLKALGSNFLASLCLLCFGKGELKGK